MALSVQDGGRLVGPYRLEHLLGKGGMGEVYAGFDARLDRRVALKRVWSGSEGDDRARRRLQREARALARLHHQAIVQVFDWVETDDGDWIVMELVEGYSLRHHLRGGPLDPDRAISLARDVLAGLAVAHAAGLVHRDLKADNVVVTTASSAGKEEQAKILDFGLAKRFDAELDETQLSLGEGLIGTLTAMSPEQCQGQEVGPRSDLFSLGSLLYEMTTGISPFRSESPAETIHRICTWIPPSVRSLEPGVPVFLSELIERLMEKDLRHRPLGASRALAEIDAVWARSGARDAARESGLAGQAGEQEEAPPTLVASPSWDSPSRDSSSPDRDGAQGDPTWEPSEAAAGRAEARGAGSRYRTGRLLIAGLAILVLLAIAVVQLRPPPETLYVAVPRTTSTTDGTREDGLDLAANAIGTALVQGLLGFQHLAAVVPEGDEASQQDSVALARALVADEVLTSTLKCSAQKCRLMLRRVSGVDGHQLWAAGFSVDTDRLLELSLATLEHLRGAYSDLELRAGIPDLEVRAADYEAFLRLKAQFDGREAGFSTEHLLGELDRLQSTSPRYLDLPLFAASALTRRFFETRSPSDLARARQAMARAQALAPEDPRTLIQQVKVMSAAGETEAAAGVLEQLGRLEPGNIHRLQLQARLLERQGQVAEALATMRQAVAQVPSAFAYFNLGNMLFRHGDIAAARRALESSLEIAPRYYNGLSLLAQLELVNGDPERAADYYEELVARSPATAELSNAGTAYLLIGRYGDAEQRFRKALEMAPGSPAVLLNLADAEFLGGRETEAKVHYQELLEVIESDPEPVEHLTIRAQALAHLGHTSEALTAVHEALRRAPDNMFTVYEASLVFAVLGDRASGVWHAQRALELGLEARWFTFPWFDSIRAELPAAAPTP